MKAEFDDSGKGRETSARPAWHKWLLIIVILFCVIKPVWPTIQEKLNDMRLEKQETDSIAAEEPLKEDSGSFIEDEPVVYDMQPKSDVGTFCEETGDYSIFYYVTSFDRTTYPEIFIFKDDEYVYASDHYTGRLINQPLTLGDIANMTDEEILDCIDWDNAKPLRYVINVNSDATGNVFKNEMFGYKTDLYYNEYIAFTGDLVSNKIYDTEFFGYNAKASMYGDFYKVTSYSGPEQGFGGLFISKQKFTLDGLNSSNVEHDLVQTSEYDNLLWTEREIEYMEQKEKLENELADLHAAYSNYAIDLYNEDYKQYLMDVEAINAEIKQLKEEFEKER